MGIRGRFLLLLLCGVTACTGQIGSRGSSSEKSSPGEADHGERSPGIASAIPRLSRREIETTIQDVFGLSGLAVRSLPPDADVAVNPDTNVEETIFDTFASSLGDYLPSEVFVQGLATLAADVATRVSANPSKLHGLAGCEPSGPVDGGCLRALIENLGLRLYRRPLEPNEVSRLQALASSFANEDGFYTGARFVIQSLLQSPDFIYRAQIGSEEEGGLHRLDNFELISRLSFLFWGAPPSPELLGRAAGPDLSEEDVQEIVQSMAADPRTDEQIRQMHAMWLRYESALVTDPQLRSALLTETEALFDRVLTDSSRPWSEIFTSTETYLGPELAAHYGMTQRPGGATWVSYENPERAGLLSHGSFLSLSSVRGNDTLPSRRGAMIASRLLCRTIPAPPVDVDVDDGVEVAPGDCKSEAYEAHRKAGSACEGCHSLIDPIGFGFERFDGLGAYRTVENDNASCAVDGLGSEGGSPFSGPREFVDLVMQSGDLTRCATEQLMRFSLRRMLTNEDTNLLESLHDAFLDSGQDFRTLLIELAIDPSFRYRKEAP